MIRPKTGHKHDLHDIHDIGSINIPRYPCPDAPKTTVFLFTLWAIN
ncbi:MAG: hypothetical protein RLZZ612_1359 [Pseudomonadota bacterium]